MNTKNKIVVIGVVSLLILGCNLGLQPATPTPLPEATQISIPLDESKVFIEGKLSWGEPLANAPIDLVVLENADPYASTVTDAEGNFSFSGLEPFNPVFGLGIDIPVAEWKCQKPDLLDETWFWTARAYQYEENKVRIWLQSYEELTVPNGILIQMSIDLKCP